MKYRIYSQGREIPEQALGGFLESGQSAIFESLRTYKDCIFLVEEHLERLKDSARTLGFRIRGGTALLANQLGGALRTYRRQEVDAGRCGNDDLFIRLTVFSGQTFVVVGRRSHPEKIYRHGVSLRTASTRKSLSHSQAPETKTNAYLNQILGTLDAGEKTYEVLFLDREGLVAEVRIGNIFIVKKGELLTPPARGILNGVTRLFVIKCALRAGIRVREEPLTRHEIYNADEVFLTNTSWEILPVRSLDDRRIGKTIPGSVTKKLQLFFKKGVCEYVRAKNQKSAHQCLR